MASFSADVSRWVQSSKRRMDNVVRGVVSYAWAGLVETSPVDTKRFINHWVVTMDGPSLVYDYVPKPNAYGHYADLGVIAARAAATIATVVAGREVWISNVTHYAKELEAGTSPQAPNGVLRVVFPEVVSELPNIVARVAGGGVP